ncbi:MAG: hypothetical protein J0M12_07915 [Deltaproteobacteria bacterium]|nr:hypothetical protein [Deltaproteobacteria bacterium]
MQASAVKNSAKTPPQKVEDFLLLYKNTREHDLLALIGLLFILAAFRFKALMSFGTNFIGGTEGDAGLYLWLIRSNTRDLFHLPWFNTQAFYPYTRTLAWSDNFILPSLVAWPFLKIGLPLAVVYNTILFAAGLLNGYCTYRLCFKLTGKLFPAFIAGAAFMTFSALTANLGHPQLQFIFWLPLTLTAVFSFISKPNFLSAYLVGLYIWLCFLCTVYYAIFIPLAVLAVLAITIVLRPRQFGKHEAGLLAAGICAGVFPLIFFVGPYFATRATFGERALYEAYYFSASALSYLSAPPFNLLYGGTSEWSHQEANLFPGFAVLLLVGAAFPRLWGAKPLQSLARSCAYLFAIACILSTVSADSAWFRSGAALFLWISILALVVLTYRMGLLERKLGFHIMTNRGLTAVLIFCALVFFAISIGPLGNPEKGHYALGVYRFFYELFPGFNSIRAIGRAGLFSVFFMCMVAGFSLAMLSEKRRIAAPLLSMVLGLCLLENFVPLYPLDAEQPKPIIVDYLATKVVDKEAAVIALPLTSELNREGNVKSWGDYARLNTMYMNWLFPANLPLVNGYSGQRSKTMKELPSQLYAFPDQRSIAALRTIAGLRYVLYSSKFDPGFQKALFEKRINDMPGDLSLVMADEDGNYLLELLGSSRIRTDTYLLAPSYPPGVVYIELMGMYQKNGPDIPVDIYAINFSESTPIASALVKQNGTWERYQVNLPKTVDTVRPDWLRFIVKADASVFFRETVYRSTPDTPAKN